MQRETIVEFCERKLREQGSLPPDLSPEALAELREAIVKLYAHYVASREKPPGALH
jgi:hypothetical protein